MTPRQAARNILHSIAADERGKRVRYPGDWVWSVRIDELRAVCRAVLKTRADELPRKPRGKGGGRKGR